MNAWKTTISSKRNEDGSYSCIDALSIEADASRIYGVLLDFNNRHRWWPNLKAWIEGPEPFAQVGSRITMRVGGLLPLARFTIRIVALEPLKRIAYEYIDGTIKGLAEWRIEPEGEGHVVKLAWQRIVPNSFPARLAFLLSGTRFHNRQTTAGLYGLKAWLEQPFP